MADEQQSAGEPIPPKYEVIEVHVAELMQLFNAIDPSPFREKDLDVNVEEFIVEWARDRESLLIGGWVAMWRPLEIFLYDWWPIRTEVKWFERHAGSDPDAQ